MTIDKRLPHSHLITSTGKCTLCNKVLTGNRLYICKECEDKLQKELYNEKWVKENPYFKGVTLDRIDSDGNYEPSNCRWATMSEQGNNRRNTVMIEHNGETHTITEWAKITGLNRSTLNNRYCRGDRGDRLFEERRYKNGTSN